MRRLYLAIRRHPLIARQPQVVRQFLKFAIVGGANTVIHMGIYVLLTRVFDVWYLIANVLAFVVAATNSYIGNRYWTFHDRTSNIPAQFAKFLTVSTIGLSINALVLSLLVEQLQLHDILATAIAISVVIIWNFGANKFWTFSGTRGSER